MRWTNHARHSVSSGREEDGLWHGWLRTPTVESIDAARPHREAFWWPSVHDDGERDGDWEGVVDRGESGLVLWSGRSITGQYVLHGIQQLE